MAACDPEKSPCDKKGLAWYDWAYSIFKNICDVKAWLAAVVNKLGVASNGVIQLAPTVHEVDADESDLKVTVPAGALSIQAIIDDEYASDHRLGVYQDDAPVLLPAGSDYKLDAITPLFNANEDGTDPVRGHGVYPSISFFFPQGSRGLVTATFKTTSSPITEETVED